MKINFFAGENKFIYGRKFTGIREKINFLAGENSTGRRATSTIMQADTPHPATHAGGERHKVRPNEQNNKSNNNEKRYNEENH